MTNHVHLVVEANDQPDSIGMLMKRLAGRQTRFVNKLERRTGSLWESRYKVSPIETDAYLLQCCRYVGLNPMKAGMVTAPEDYEWSSYATKIGSDKWGWLDVDPCFSSLAKNVKACQEACKRFALAASDAKREHAFIAAAVERNQLTGTQRFIDEVECRTGVRIEHRAQGRPKKLRLAEVE